METQMDSLFVIRPVFSSDFHPTEIKPNLESLVLGFRVSTYLQPRVTYLPAVHIDISWGFWNIDPLFLSFFFLTGDLGKKSACFNLLAPV